MQAATTRGPDRINGEETMTAAESADLAQRYDPRDVQEKWQARWAELEPFRASDDPDDQRPRFYALDMFPTRPATCTWATPRRSPEATRWRGFSPGTGRPAPHRIPRVRPERRERGRSRPTRSIPRNGPTRTSINRRRRSSGMGMSFDWSRGGTDVRSRVLPMDAVAVPAVLRTRADVSEERSGQLVPARPDGAGERAGDQWGRVRAMRH